MKVNCQRSASGPDLMRHVGQELRFTSICQLRSLPGGSVLLDTVSQVKYHLVDLRLQRVHLPARLNRDESTEVAVHCRGGDLGETTHLRS